MTKTILVSRSLFKKDGKDPVALVHYTFDALDCKADY